MEMLRLEVLPATPLADGSLDQLVVAHPLGPVRGPDAHAGNGSGHLSTQYGINAAVSAAEGGIGPGEDLEDAGDAVFSRTRQDAGLW